MPHGPEVVEEPKAEEENLPNVPSRDEGALQLVDNRVKREEEAISDDEGYQLNVTPEIFFFF